MLDDLLDNKPGANDVEVLNMAVNGWGPFEEFGYVEKFGTFNADVAIVCLPIGDIYRRQVGAGETCRIFRSIRRRGSGFRKFWDTWRGAAGR